MTLRARLLLLLVSLLAGALAVSGVLLTLGVREYAQAQSARAVRQALSGVALAGAGLESRDERLGVWYRQLSESALGLNSTGMMILPGGTAYRTDNLPPSVPAGAVAQARRSGQAQDGAAFLLATSDDTVLLLNMPLTEVNALTRRVALTFAGVGGLTLLLSVVVGWFLLRVGLRPVQVMARQAETLGGDDLSARLPLPAPPDEVRSLADSLNRMLARLEETFTRLRAEEARTRAFAADASHELRTPLAAIQGSLEVLERTADDPLARERLLGALRRESRRAARLVDDLLTLTRLDGLNSSGSGGGTHAAGALRLEVLALTELLGEVIGTACDLAPHLNFTLDTVPVVVQADRQRLEGAVWNLVRNAMTATPGGGTVTVRLSQEAAQGVVRLAVLNPAQLPEDFLARMFDRFARGPDAPSGGSGLGLAIVQATARAHGGQVFAVQHDGQLEVGFTLPGVEGHSTSIQRVAVTPSD